MSPRAASRLEQLGFTEVYDYVPSKADWLANGLPREGSSASEPWAGDLVREEMPTCAAGDPVGAVRQRVVAGGFDFCVVVDRERVVVGVLRGDALAKDPDARAEEVMELGPNTLRPSNPVEEVLNSRSYQGVKHWIVTTSHGVLLGVVHRDDARRAVEESRAKAA